MAGGIRQRNLNSDWRLCGVYASESAYKTARNIEDEAEGDIYYDTTRNQLRTYDGSDWSPAGQSGISAGSLTDAYGIGQTITLTGSNGVTILCPDDTVSAGPVLFLNNDEDTDDISVIQIDDEGAGVCIEIDGGGYDIQGTGDTWEVDYLGVGAFSSLFLADNATIQFGDTVGDPDWTLAFDTATLEFIPADADAKFAFGDGAPRCDVKIYGTSAAQYVEFDASANEAIFEGYDIGLQDDDQLLFGNSNDVVIDWETGGTFQITPLAANQAVKWGASATGFEIYWYGDTANRNLRWSSTYDRLIFESDASGVDVMCQFDDYAQLTFGATATFGAAGSGDVQMWFGGGNFYLDAATADEGFLIGDTSTGFDITYYFEGSGPTITTDYDGDVMTFNEADLAFGDDDYILLGDSATPGEDSDGTVRWDSTDEKIEIIGATRFESAVTMDGALTLAGTFTHTGSFNPGSLQLDDSENLLFGSATDGDISIDFVDGATLGTQGKGLLIAGVGGVEQVQFGDSTYELDVIFVGAAAAQFIHFDGSANELIVEGVDINLMDDDVLQFGDDPDFEIYYEETTTDNLIIRAAVANDAVQIGDGTTGTDLKCVSSGDTAAFFLFDASHDTANGGVLFGADDHGIDAIFYGASTGCYVNWDQSANTWYFGQDGTGVDAYFYGDTAGDNAMWDYSADSLIFTDAKCVFSPTTSGGNVDYTFQPSDTYGLADALQLAATDHTAANLILGTTTANGLNVILQGSVCSAHNVAWDAGGETLTLTDSYLVFSPTVSAGTCDYTFGQSTIANMEDSLQLSATDSQSSALLIGTTGTHGLDVVFQGATTTADRVTFDAASESMTLTDYDLVFSPTVSAGTIDYTFKQSTIANQEDSLNFGATDSQSAALLIGTTGTHGLDVVFQGATSTADRMAFDAAALTLTLTDISLVFDPSTSAGNVDYTFGTATTFMTGDALALTATDSASAVLWIGSTGTNGLNVIFQGATTNADRITWDAGAESLTFTDCDLVFSPTDSAGNVDYTFKQSTSGNDDTLEFSATNHANALLQLGSSTANGLDVVFQGGNVTGDDITWNAANLTMTFTDTSLVFSPTTSGGNVDYAFGPATTFMTGDALGLTATDSASAVLWIGDTGTNGVDVIFQGTSSNSIRCTWDAGSDTMTLAADAELVTTIGSTEADGVGLRIPLGTGSTTSATGGRVTCTSSALWIKPGTTSNWMSVAIAS